MGVSDKHQDVCWCLVQVKVMNSYVHGITQEMVSDASLPIMRYITSTLAQQVSISAQAVQIPCLRISIHSFIHYALRI